ncbi:MAG: hypothetical protein AAF403_05335, partial [Pseudomonadota bacterium]
MTSLSTQNPKGLIVAASGSNSGKTLITNAILHLFSLHSKDDFGAYKCGPDYIDPTYLKMASAKPAYNLDPWAMRPQTIKWLLCQHQYCIIEGVTGLFDGAKNGAGSTASLAKLTGFPVILVVSAKARAQSLAAEISGFCHFDPDICISGVILNHVASFRHLTLIREALSFFETRLNHQKPLPPIIGAMASANELTLPSRHLGLVQAHESAHPNRFLNHLYQWATQSQNGSIALKHQVLKSLMRPLKMPKFDPLPLKLFELPFMYHPTCRPLQKTTSSVSSSKPALKPHIAIASDQAFSFCYAHWLLLLTQKQLENVIDLTFFS